MSKKTGILFTAGGCVMAAAGGLSVNADGYWIVVSILCFIAGLILLYFGLNQMAAVLFDEYDEMPTEKAEEYSEQFENNCKEIEATAVERNNTDFEEVYNQTIGFRTDRLIEAINAEKSK